MPNLHACELSEASVETAKQQRSPGEIAYIPGENAALHGLGQANRDLVREVGGRCAEQKIATIDRDATIIGSRKQEALRTYGGERGYQPMLAVWGNESGTGRRVPERQRACGL